jgi:hypothetical protein
MTTARAAAWLSQEDDASNAVLSLPGALLPIMEKVSRGRFVPESGIHADPDAIKAAIATATGATVKRVVLVSYAGSSSDDAWTKDETYAVTLAESLERRLGFGLSIKLGGDRWKKFREQCGYEEPVRLVDYLARSQMRIAKRNLQFCIFAVMGFVFAQDHDMAARLAPLLRHMPAALPLGELRTEPGTWLVLVP